jgi:hypothetical protein
MGPVSPAGGIEKALLASLPWREGLREGGQKILFLLIYFQFVITKILKEV